MADADNTLTVDGVEPSIAVRLLDIKDNPERVQIYTSDDGTDRYLVKGGEPVLLTQKDIGTLGPFSVEIENAGTQKSVFTTASTPATPGAPNAPGQITSPGQSG